MAKRFYKKPRPCTIRFYDHFSTQGHDNGDSAIIEIRGWIWAEDKIYYYVTFTIINNISDHPQSIQFAVVKKAVKNMW